MEIAAARTPVTYVTEGMRSLILVDLEWDTILLAFHAAAVAGAVMLGLDVR